MARPTRHDFVTQALSYLDEVTAYARNLTRSEWDGDDLTQAAYEQAFRKWSTLRDLARCRAWLFRITRNLHLDRVRASGARPEGHLVDVSPGAREAILSAEAVERLTARELDAALDRLPEEQRQALLLCDLWGFSYGEIGEIVDVPVGTVRSRISRGRALLGRLLVGPGRRVTKSGVPS